MSGRSPPIAAGTASASMPRTIKLSVPSRRPLTIAHIMRHLAGRGRHLLRPHTTGLIDIPGIRSNWRGRSLLSRIQLMSDASTVLDLPPAPPHLANDPVLRRAREGLREIYGDRLAGVIVYGSRARGDQRPDSDYDLIALIRQFDGKRDWKRELHELTDDLFPMEPYE